MSLIKRIPISKVELGMYVSDLTPGIDENELRPKGFIRRWETVDKLADMGLKELYIDVHRGIDSPFSLPVPTNEGKMEPKVALEKEREQAIKVYAETKNVINNLLRDVKLGNPISIGPIHKLAEEINNSLINNHNALLCLAAIREKDQYLLEHSVNVGILMGIFSRFLGYETETVHELVTGAILHDIGKIRVPNQILNKPGKLTETEWVEMKRHVVYGQEVLLKTEGVSDVTLSICGMHHERMDGTGYPMGLKEYEINNYGRLAAIVDIYDALTATRVYNKGRPPEDVLKFMLELAGHHLDKDLLLLFIRCMSVYPVGTVVELSNGKLGVVVSTHHEKPSNPTVRVFYNLRHKHYLKPELLDLSGPRVDISVTGTINPEHHGINTSDFI